MNTIRVEGAFIKASLFIKEGGKLLDDKYNNKIANQYREYVISINEAHWTRTKKLRAVYFLGNYLMTKDKNFKNFAKQDIYDYFDECSRLSWGIPFQDRNKYDIKLFLNWCYKNNFTKLSGDMIVPRIIWHPCINIRTYYSQEEITKLLNIIDIRTKRGKEDFLILSLVCYLGLRISDVINLKLSSIDFNKNTISIIQYKTKAKLFLPLINQVKYPLLDYLKNVRPKDTDLDYVFVTQNPPYKQNINLKVGSQKIKKYLEKAGVNINGRKHGYHAFRHSFSTSLLKENVSLYSISSILGHQDIKTTMLYLNIDTSKLKELALEVPYVK